MKSNTQIKQVTTDLFPELKITINPELANASRAGSVKKVAAAKKILSKVKFPS